MPARHACTRRVCAGTAAAAKSPVKGSQPAHNGHQRGSAAKRARGDDAAPANGKAKADASVSAAHAGTVGAEDRQPATQDAADDAKVAAEVEAADPVEAAEPVAAIPESKAASRGRPSLGHAVSDAAGKSTAPAMNHGPAAGPEAAQLTQKQLDESAALAEEVMKALLAAKQVRRRPLRILHRHTEVHPWLRACGVLRAQYVWYGCAALQCCGCGAICFSTLHRATQAHRPAVWLLVSILWNMHAQARDGAQWSGGWCAAEWGLVHSSVAKAGACAQIRFSELGWCTIARRCTSHQCWWPFLVSAHACYHASCGHCCAERHSSAGTAPTAQWLLHELLHLPLRRLAVDVADAPHRRCRGAVACSAALHRCPLVLPYCLQIAGASVAPSAAHVVRSAGSNSGATSSRRVPSTSCHLRCVARVAADDAVGGGEHPQRPLRRPAPPPRPRRRCSHDEAGRHASHQGRAQASWSGAPPPPCACFPVVALPVL